MPQVQKQAPPVKVVQTKPASTSIFDEVELEAVDENMSVLIYGRNRIGKTTFAAEFKKPILHLALEPTKTGGAKSIAPNPLIDKRVCRDSDKISKFAEGLHTTKHKYKTVVLDSVTSWQKIILNEVKGVTTPIELLKVGNKSTVTIDDYVERAEKMMLAIRPFLEAPDIDVVILANEKDHNPPENRKNSFAKGMQEGSFFAADTGAGLARWLMDNCDYIVQMFMDQEIVTTTEMINGKPVKTEMPTGKLIRRLRLQYHPNFAAGIRTPKLDLPEFVDGKRPIDLYNNFMKAIR